MSIIRNVFEDPRERAQAIGVWGGVIGISMALGPVLGGALVDSVGWRAVFLVNLPVGLAAIVLTALFVPESRAGHARRFDPIGQVLVIVALATLTYGIIEGPGNGWLSGRTLGAVRDLARGVRGARALRAAPQRAADRGALLPQRAVLGRERDRVCAFAGLGGFLFFNTLYLQEVRGLSPLDAGLYVLPLAFATLVIAPLSGRVVGSRGSRWPLVGGSLGLIASAAILTQLTATTPFWPADPLLRAVRHRLRADQPADHEHRGLGDAAVAGRRRRRGSPRPAARSEPRSASRCSARSPPAPPGWRAARRSPPRPMRAGGWSSASGSSRCCSAC